MHYYNKKKQVSANDEHAILQVFFLVISPETVIMKKAQKKEGYFMIYLLLTIIGASMFTFILRLSRGRITGKYSMYAADYFLCLIFSGYYMGIENIYPAVEKNDITLALGIINGFLYLLSLFFYQYCIQKNGVVLTIIFSKLGIMVPLLTSILLFHEIPTVLQIIGTILAVVFMVLINYEKGHTKSAFNISLLIILLVDGTSAAMAKIFGEVGNSALSAQFLFYTFVIAFAISLGLAIYKKEHVGFNEVIFGFGVGSATFFVSRFMLKALETVPAVIAYPTRAVGTLILVTMMGVLFFKERLRKQQWIAMGGIVAALTLLNI